MVSTVYYLNRVKMVSPEIFHLSFFEAVVDTHFVRDKWAAYAKMEMKMTYKLLALQLASNRRDGEGR